MSGGKGPLGGNPYVFTDHITSRRLQTRSWIVMGCVFSSEPDPDGVNHRHREDPGPSEKNRDPNPVVFDDQAAHDEKEYAGSRKPTNEPDRQAVLEDLSVLNTVRPWASMMSAMHTCSIYDPFNIG